MGPVCSILLREKIDVKTVATVDATLQRNQIGEFISTALSRNFRIDYTQLQLPLQEGSDCMFTLQYDAELEDMYDNELAQINAATKQEIRSQIIISASCNRLGDHYILAALAWEILDTLDGFIDFGGDLNMFNNRATVEIPGQIVSIPYNNGTAHNHISDKRFLRQWIEHEDFAMVK